MVEKTMDSVGLDRALELLGALAVETRLKLLVRLAQGERCVCELWTGVGEQSNVSRHLARLKELGVVACRVDGPRRMYHITDPRVLRVLEALDLAPEGPDADAPPARRGCDG
ncbi:MAG: metalloregulator ArsR/SmtB family transcription factor [bacterium]|nr:metalloregulator ArsR/SmtB family transcription factor [bacterium]